MPGSTIGNGGYTTNVNTLYDGEGHRVEQQVNQFGCSSACGTTTTTTHYVAAGVEDVTLAQSGTSTTKYYAAGGLLIGVNVNGTISYLASDGLGSVATALSSGGTLVAAQLFAPYGGVRSSSGSMPTVRGFTGQYGDAITGLSYYGARHYDPVAGQFTTADFVQGPNRYAYVLGNPTTWTDPSGQHMAECYDNCGGASIPVDPVDNGVEGVSGKGPIGEVSCEVACVEAEYGLPPEVLDDTGATASLDEGLNTAEEVGQEAGRLHAALHDEDLQLAADQNVSRTATDLHAQETASTTTTTSTTGSGTEGTGSGTDGTGSGGTGSGGGAPSAGMPSDSGGGGGAGGGENGGGNGDIGGMPPGYPSSTPPNFNDPTQPPSPDWQWQPLGSTPGTGQGSWWNAATRESWHPDLGHPYPQGPHWDYSFRGMNSYGFPYGWRWMPDGSFVPKVR